MSLLQTARDAWKQIRRDKWPTGYEAVVYSEVLQEEVIWAADDTNVTNSHKKIVYREALVRRIVRANLSPHALRELHGLLKVLPEDHFKVVDLFATSKTVSKGGTNV